MESTATFKLSDCLKKYENLTDYDLNMINQFAGDLGAARAWEHAKYLSDLNAFLAEEVAAEAAPAAEATPAAPADSLLKKDPYSVLSVKLTTVELTRVQSKIEALELQGEIDLAESRKDQLKILQKKFKTPKGRVDYANAVMNEYLESFADGQAPKWAEENPGHYRCLATAFSETDEFGGFFLKDE